MRKFRRGTADIRGVGWMFLAALPFILGLMWLFMSTKELNLWLHADQYIDAELEVTKFHYEGGGEGIDPDAKGIERRRRGRKVGRTSHPNKIEGVIHPTGEAVWTNDRDVSVAIFEEPDGMVGRTPTKEEIEGKRIKVLFWPNHDAEKGWFDPPTTLTAARPTTRAIVIDFLIVVVLLGAAFLCFTKARRRMRAKAGPIPKGPGTWPAWAGLVGVMTLLLWPLFLLICAAFTSGLKMNKAGTERVPLTSQEWLYVFGLIAAFAVPTVACTGLTLYAMWNRYVRARPSPVE